MDEEVARLIEKIDSLPPEERRVIETLVDAMLRAAHEGTDTLDAFAQLQQQAEAHLPRLRQRH